jgi:DNA polymerase III delta prime subunit
VNASGIVLHASAQILLDELTREPSHAVLLTGPLGIGKTHTARSLGATLLGATDAALENQAYYCEVAPQKGSISIEQIRTLIKFFRLSVPGTARIKRVAVIQDAETMGREAQNALLKLLEEPPAGSVLILTSSQPEQLLQTVRSRTQAVMLTAPDQQTLIAHFVTLGYDAASVQRTLLRTGSNVAEAIRLLSVDAASPDDALNLVKKVLSGTAYDRMLLVDGLAKQKEQAVAFVGTLAATAIASLQSAATKNPTALPRWQAILEAANIAGTALDRSGNTKLVLTELMLTL